MAIYLSDEWHKMALGLADVLPEREGVSIRIAFVISGAPSGDRKYYQIVENGRLLAQANGTIADADVTLTVSWADSIAMHTGELDPNVAMMQGRAKIAGNMGRVIAALPLSTGAEYTVLQEKIRSHTELP